MRREHQKEKEYCVENPPDALKVNCPKCQKLFGGIDFKAHLKSKHHSNCSGIECFKCQFEAENLEDFKMHAKQHISNGNEVQHEMCNVCSEVFRNKAVLTMHIRSVHNEDCELCLKVFRNQLELMKHVDNVSIANLQISKVQ